MASFKSVLKKIGEILLKGSAAATEIMGFPFVSQLLGQASPKVQTIVTTAVMDLNTLAGIAALGEVVFPLTGSGPQRVAALAPLVQQGIILWADSHLPGHNKLKDPEKLAAASAGMLANFADALNSFGE